MPGKHCLMTYLMAWLVCISLRVVVADLSRYCNSNSSPVRGGVCGSRLDQVLKIYCKAAGGYNGYYNKRAGPLHAVVNAPEVDVPEMFLPKSQAHTFLEKRGYMFQGVVCECCYNQCGLREMKEYCQQDRAVRVNKKALYQQVPAPYARVATAKLSNLQNARTAQAEQSLNSWGNSETDRELENGLSPAKIPTDSVAIYLHSLLANSRLSETP